VILSVSDDESLADVLDRAARALNVSGFGRGYGLRGTQEPSRQFSYVAFREGGPDSRPDPRKLLFGDQIPLVTDDAQVRWVHAFSAAPYRDIVRAAEAHLLDGDPRTLYLVRQSSAGGGPAFHHDFQTWLDLITIAEIELARLGEIREGIEAARAIIRRAIQVVRRRRPRWEQADRTPARLADVANRTADPDGLARLLGCEVAEAEAVLEQYGFERAADGRWRKRSDAIADVLDAVDEVMTEMGGYVFDPRIDTQRLLADHLRDRLTTGQLTPKPLSDYTLHDEGEGQAGLRPLTPPNRLSRRHLIHGAEIVGAVMVGWVAARRRR
jgi:hypothetical protein